ncbi:TetR/AcrR family transcriptional regulator [Dactylosporangium salmoneum]|uniref:TetR/AcrR family transcriptional regulator n=1 Tax=Dactylosporangium salmoneum TaxID=53361 RepID=A0ABN3HU28_9ACTN
MERLSRAETQQRTRARVLAAARDEFTERGYRDAKIDAIAERAGLTRGGVYSNFAGKRALYFAVLADSLAEPAAFPDPGRTAREALGLFARAWVGSLPLFTNSFKGLAVDLVPEIMADEMTRVPYAQLLNLDAVLLGLALERLHPAAGRRTGVAASVLTQLHGASRLAVAAPGFVDEFAVVAACERLAGLDLEEPWNPPHLPHAPEAVACDEPWSPPPAHDAIQDAALLAIGSGVVTVLGLRRAAAVEEAVRAAAPGTPITAVLVTDRPEELADLSRLVVAELMGCLRAAFPSSAWPDLALVHDPAAALAAAAGVTSVSDTTETAVLVRGGRIVARAEGFGAGHAVASLRP